MNKITKVVACVTIAAVAAVCGVAAGCSADKTGEAYGLVHNAGYVGYTKIKVNGDKVKDLTLTEVCLPTHVKAGGDVAGADKVGSYYKTVSYGEVTLTYSESDGGYTVDGKTLKEYLREEANAKAYFDAVASDSVTVTVGGQKKSGVMTNAALSKELNGYWSGENISGQGWMVNRDKTVGYVKNYGVSKLSTLTREEDGTWKDANGINTGATWNDLGSDKEGTLSYAQLILKAYDAAAK